MLPKNQSIILTNCKFSPGIRHRLMSSVGAKFALRTIDDVRESELAQIEIMLVDIIQKSAREWLGREKLSQMPRLRLIQSLRAGVDAVDFEQIPEGMIVCGNVGAYSEPIAEHVMGMVLYLAKDLGNKNTKLKSGIADHNDSLFLNGKTMAMIGTGGIGQAVAKIAKCLGMKTLGVNTSGKPARYFDQMFAIERLNQVLAMSDVIILSLPLTVKTLHIIDEEKLSRMKKNCILVNVGRGYVIDERALYYHLKRNAEFKCGLDVWWHYPKGDERFLQNFPFLELSNFLGTPHVSGFVPEEHEISLGYAVDNVVRFANSRKLKGLVNREDYEGLRELIKGTKTS